MPENVLEAARLDVSEGQYALERQREIIATLEKSKDANGVAEARSRLAELQASQGERIRLFIAERSKTHAKVYAF